VDFSYHYTEEQQQFRQEVSEWLIQVTPDNLDELQTPSSGSAEPIQKLRKLLGEKGWLAATDSRETGGAGLTADHNVVILEELNRLGLLFLLEDETATLRSAVLQWGDDNQNDELVLPIAQGEFSVWKQVVASGDFLDPDNVGITATPDADGYILDGEANFSGHRDRPSRIWTLALIEPDADDQPIPVSFLVTPDSNGLSISTSRTLVSGTVRRVEFNEVWVPRFDLLGAEGDGAAVITGRVQSDPRADLPTLLESETDALLEYSRNTESGGESLSAEPIRQQLLVEAYIASRVMRLLRMRSAWLQETEQGEGHEDAETALWEDRASQLLSETTQDVVGIYAMLDASDPRSPDNGRFDRLQRRELATRNPGASGNTNSETIANSLGMADGPKPEKQEPSKGE
jgi:alkylation response protein AidB-like acyl-CoA dehydrogenase